jgi:hypothetical protein
MGDVAVITPEQQAAFTMYSVPGQNTDGPMTQKAVTDNLVASAISYDNSQSGLASDNVQGALDEVAEDILFADITKYLIQKKRIQNNGGVGAQLGSVTSHNDWKYIKYPVQEGDVVKISGYATGGTWRLWAIVDSNDTIIDAEKAVTIERKDYIIRIPKNAAYIVINNYGSRTGTPNWLYASKSTIPARIEYGFGDMGYREDIPISLVTRSYYDGYSGSVAIRTDTGGNFSRASEPIDITGWDGVSLKMYIEASYQPRTFFADDNGNTVGVKLDNESGDWIDYQIPAGATKLYFTTRTGTQASYGVRSIINKSVGETRDILENEIKSYGESERGTEEIIGALRTYGYYWANNGTQITGKTIDSNNNFSCFDAIDISRFSSVLLKFYAIASYGATTAFTDDNGNIIKRLFSTTSGYVEFDVPQGATKLYISTRHASLSSAGVKGVYGKKNLSLKVFENGDSIGRLIRTSQNIFIDYRFDAASGSYYTVVRVNKKKFDGSLQYAHVFAPYGAARGRWSTLGMNTGNYEFDVAINAGIFDTTTIIQRGTLIVNGVVLKEETDPARPFKLLVVDSNGDLGYRDQDVSGAELLSQGIVGAVAGWEPIIDNYLPLETHFFSDPSASDYQAQRQIIGQFGNGDYAIVTNEGRGNMVSDGWSMTEAKNVCVSLGLKFAYNLDGGGSTETVVWKKQLNTIYEGTSGRVVPTYIVFNGRTNLL